MRLDRVAIVTKFGSRKSEDAAGVISKKLLDAGAKKVYTVSESEVRGAERVGDTADLRGAGLDLAITLGGDGTTLRAVRGLDGNVPTLTVNVGGNRGILSEITMDGADEAIRQMLGGAVFLDRRVRITASVGGREVATALNEVFLSRANLTRTAEFEIRFQNDTLRQKMDGVIVATPSGSTGHSFSLGGPVLHESLDVLIITPVAPVFRLESIVVPDEKIEVTCSHDCNVVIDAQVVRPAGFGEPITISRHKNAAVFVRLKKSGLRQMIKLGF